MIKPIKPTAYLRKLDKELKEVSAENKIDQQYTEDIIDDFFLIMKSMIEDPRMPKIQITNFGTFKPTLGKINYEIVRALRAFRAEKIERYMVVNKIQKLWPIRNRLIKEKSGIHTWKEWQHKKMNNGKQD